MLVALADFEMNEDSGFWETAINARRSVRAYERKPVAAAEMERLVAFAGGLEKLLPQTVEMRFFKTEENRRLANNLGKPPEDAVAFMAETDPASVAAVGFTGELFLLYATGLGISTCWFGHYILRELERLMPHLGEHAGGPYPQYGIGIDGIKGRRAICISPLGYVQTGGLRLLDRMTSNLMSFKRKPVGDRLENGMKPEALPPELLFALETAMKAPSAANTQHWSFNVSRDFKTVIIAKPKGYRHFRWEYPDVCAGACAAHFWLGLRIRGVPCEIAVSSDEDRAIWRFAI